MAKPRITGMGVGPASVQWEYIATNKDLAQRVIDFLEDRRVLTEPNEGREDGEFCRRSAEKIRNILTNEIAIANLQGGGPLKLSLKRIQAACRAFITSAGKDGIEFMQDHLVFMANLVAFREVVGFEIRKMIELFHVDVSPQLMAIVPQQDLSWLPNSDA